MEAQNIVKLYGPMSESVDVDALLGNTKRVSRLPLGFRWDRVRHLHFLGDEQTDYRKKGPSDARLTPGWYLNDSKTWVFAYCVPAQEIRKGITRCSYSLEQLSVRCTSIRELDLSRVCWLKDLCLQYNYVLSRIHGLEQLREIEKLDLAVTSIGPELDLNGFPSLRFVNISSTQIKHIELGRKLEQLTAFTAHNTGLGDVRFLRFCPELLHLNVSASPVSDLSFLERLTKLRKLYLDSTWISRIPDVVRNMEELAILYLSGLELEELPDWFPELLNRCKFLGLSGTTVQGMEPGFLEQPKEVILQWFEEHKKAKEAPETDAGAPLNEVKVVFLGDGEAGKTHTIARLLNDGGDPENFIGDSTPGIVITDKSYDLGDRRVQVHFWDFGGQEILHSMHRMFLTERTLYVILINARDDTQDDRARYWLHNVKSFAGGAPVLLVLNKIDQNPNASVNETDLRDIYPGLTQVVKLSAMFDDREKFNASFTEAMKRQIAAMDNLNFFFPASWTRAKQRLQGMEENYIRGNDYAAICEDCGITGEGGLRRSLLNWFNDLGVSICYGGARLRDYVILRPNWITNAVYAILFNKHPDTQNGIISHEAIFEMIQPPAEGADVYRRTNPGETYQQHEIDFVLNVMRKFRLSFRVNDDQEFIPVLCQRESLPIAAEYAGDDDALEFRMTFSYLPNNVLHRLMVELRQDLDTVRVWRTGAHFEQRSSGLSAVVKSEGNVLKFYVRSAGKNHKASTYLCILKDAVDSIVKDMNLEPPLNEVVYKLEGKRQVFDYDELVESRDNGESIRYSRAHKRRLQIEDILNQTGREAEEAREQLLRDMVSFCCQLQANKQNWNAREDVRNTYIRDLLRARGYHVFDQTFSGRSASGKQAGELDLEIRLDANVPWTICEAMNLKGAGESQIRYWNAHLDKLLGAYNANGLPFLFLVSYVDCGRDHFGAVTGAFREHLHFYSPGAYARQSAEDLPLDAQRHEQSHYIQAAKCVYDRGGFRTTVYHLFVHMGE